MPAKDKRADDPVSFTLKIGGKESAGVFKEATGLGSESEVSEIKRSLPNGRTQVIKAAANTKWGDIELKRGVDTHGSLSNWRKLVIDGKLEAARRDCTVTILDSEGRAVATYSIINAWPRKYTGGGLRAGSKPVAVEGITLCHEGFEIQ